MKTLREKTQAVRDKVKEGLKMSMINKCLSSISTTKLDISNGEKEIKRLEKQLEINIYEIKKEKLDPEHPDYEERMKEVDEKIEQMEKEAEHMIAQYKEKEERLTKTIEEQEERITNIEKGEYKIMLSDLNRESANRFNDNSIDFDEDDYDDEEDED